MAGLFHDDALTMAQEREIAAMEVTSDEAWREGAVIVTRDANGHLMALQPDGRWISETEQPRERTPA